MKRFLLNFLMGIPLK